MRHKKQTVYFVVLLTIVSLIGLLVPRNVTAQSTGEWKSRSTIILDGKTYFDDTTDSSYNYKLQGDSDSCVDEIHNLTDGNSRGKLRIRIPSAVNQSNCQVEERDVNLSSTDNSYKFFVWVDEATITTSDGRNTYKLDSALGAFMEVGGDSCKDTITMEGLRDGQITVRTNGPNTSFNESAYKDGPYAINLGSSRDEDGCETYGPIQAVVAMEENARRQAGTGETPGGNTSEDGTNEDESCEAKLSNALGWAVCGVLGVLDEGLTALRNVVISMLVIDANQYDDDSLRQAWSYFRNIASLLLVIIGLIMVIGQAVGKD